MHTSHAHCAYLLEAKDEEGTPEPGIDIKGRVTSFLALYLVEAVPQPLEQADYLCMIREWDEGVGNSTRAERAGE